MAQSKRGSQLPELLDTDATGAGSPFDFIEWTDENRARMPKFTALLTRLRAKMTSSAVMISEEKKLDEAKRKLAETKTEFMRNKIIYDEIKDVVFTMDVKQLENRMDKENHKFHEELKRVVTRAEIYEKLTCLKADALGEAKCNEGLLGQSALQYQDVKLSAAHAERLDALLNDRLGRRLIEMAKCYVSLDSDNNDSETDYATWLERGLQLQLVVRKDVEKLSRARKQLTLLQVRLQSALRNYYLALSETITMMLKLAEMCLTDDQMEQRAQLGSALMRVTLLKLKVFQLETLNKIYPKEVVKAHQVVRDRLQDSNLQLKSQKEVLEQKLAAYSSTDADFQTILSEYQKVTKHIKELEWLSDMTESETK